MATLPEHADLSSVLKKVEQPTRTYIIDQDSKQVIGMDEGLAAMRQAVGIALQTERFRWQIYSSNFGAELEDLPGEEYDYIVGELPRRIQEALAVDSRVISTDNFIFKDLGGGELLVTFDVQTVFGVVQEEVIV